MCVLPRARRALILFPVPRSFLRILLLALVLGRAACAAEGPAPAAARFARAWEAAATLLPTVAGAVHPDNLLPAASGTAGHQPPSIELADYANNRGADPSRYESFADAAKRIIAGETSQKQPPDATSRELRRTADAILAAVTAAEAGGMPQDAAWAAEAGDLRVLAHLARFQSHRMIAAVRYNLFKRSLKLAELVASVYDEKAALAAWREVVAAAGDRTSLQVGPGIYRETGDYWKRHLKRLEVNFRELEEQCCPPDEAVMREKVWQPVEP